MPLESVTERLTLEQNQVLKASARLDYRGVTIKWVQDTLHIRIRTVKVHNKSMFTQLNVNEIFSAVAYALNNGIIDLSDVVVSEEQLESIINTIENREYGNRTYLTAGGYSVLREYYTRSLETGNLVGKQVVERVDLNLRTIQEFVRELYTKTPANNRAQLAVIGYIQDQLIKGEDVRKQYRGSAQPVS